MTPITKSKGTTLAPLNDPIELFKEWARAYGTVTSSIPILPAQGNLLTIEIRPLPGDDGTRLDQLDMEHILLQLGQIPGLNDLKPKVCERALDPWDCPAVPTATATATEGATVAEPKPPKFFTVHIDRDLWTAEDKSRGYRKSPVLIKTSVNEKEDKRLVRNNRSKAGVGKSGRMVHHRVTKRKTKTGPKKMN